MEKLNSGMGRVIQPTPESGLRQVVQTQNGSLVGIPMMMGSSTEVKPLEDGTYQVVTKPASLNAQPEIKILTEDELVARYGAKTGTRFQAIA